MAAPVAAPTLPLSGPEQRGRVQLAQYVYWIVMPHPTAESLANTMVKRPSDFTHQSFNEPMVKAHKYCGTALEETAVFLEPHAHAPSHLNLLTRSLVQYRWQGVAEHLLKEHEVHVSFGEKVRAWGGLDASSAPVLGCRRPCRTITHPSALSVVKLTIRERVIVRVIVVR